MHGALLFLESKAKHYASSYGVNIVVAPCVSPWGYERIQRWNAEACDPNRTFRPGRSPVAGGQGSAMADSGSTFSEEAAALLRHLEALAPKEWLLHVDLHETTDTDETEFRPAKQARNGEAFEPDTIPDGFYIVGDADSAAGAEKTGAFLKAIIERVRPVTHIAPADGNGKIIGEPMTQEGVISLPCKQLGLCAGATDAPYVTTTEVYPDSPKASPEQCNRAQVAAIAGALEYVLAERGIEPAASCADA